MRASIFYAAVQAWNNLMFPEEEKKLGRDRRQLHLILGKGPDGMIHSIRLQGALSDALEWFGAGNLLADVKQMRAGKKTLTDEVVEAAKAPVDRIIQGWEPVAKTLFEVASGSRAYPSVFKEGAKLEFARHPIRDRAEYVADAFWPLGALYRKVTGRPIRPSMSLGVPGAGALLEALVMYKTDPGEAAYWETQDLVRRWKDSQNKGGGGAPDLGGPMKTQADALYYFRKACEWNDQAAAKKWLQEYFTAGGTLRSMQSHVRHASPIAGLPLRERHRFIASLRPADRNLFNEAQEWSDRGKEAMRQKLGERDFAIPRAARPVSSVYSDPAEEEAAQ
jgi:hypothetical protein